MKFAILLLFVFAASIYGQTLGEALGYPKDAKILIVNADDFGMCHSENVATLKGMEEGSYTSATVMIPCSWSYHALLLAKQKGITSVGVHATFTSEFGKYRWRPMTYAPSLIDDDGFFWEDNLSVEKNANVFEVINELKAQINFAQKHLPEITHFDSHMGTLYGLETLRVDMFAASLACSHEYGLPFRLPYMKEFQPLRDMGFAVLDHLIQGGVPGKTLQERRRSALQIIKNLKPGVSEIYLHPSLHTPESRAITSTAAARQLDMEIFMDKHVEAALKKNNVHLISYKPLRDWQRKQMKWKKGQVKAEDVYDHYHDVLWNAIRKSPYFQSKVNELQKSVEDHQKHHHKQNKHTYQQK